MAHIVLDALIPRADFCEADYDATSAQKLHGISLQQLGKDSYLVPALRKPDFQRETNHWTDSQVITFLESFLDNELVPSLIFWQAPGKVFVIDGAHRVSAILAWVNDDYGDGTKSKAFFGNEISKEQEKAAVSLRNKIGRQIGSFSDFHALMTKEAPEGVDPIQLKRANNAKTRMIDLQWVEGDAEKAESSFFKINKQGTPLDKTEERLLVLRRCPIAIAARSIVRASSGHKYWSQFEKEKRIEIEKLSKELHGMLFSPEIDYPIKTLNLPHGGKSSPISAYNLLMDLIALALEGSKKQNKESKLYQPDNTGEETIRVLKYLLKVLERITGNQINSLGLHPAVFFYSETGKHWDIIFLSFVNVVARAIKNGNKAFFRGFTKNRYTLEQFFKTRKSFVAQANGKIRSVKRIEKWTEFFEEAAKGKILYDGQSDQEILSTLGLTGSVIVADAAPAGKEFNPRTKSAIFLAGSLQSATVCPLCLGLIQSEKSVSYDHIISKDKGGLGSMDNIQMTHPYCNSIKN